MTLEPPLRKNRERSDHGIDSGGGEPSGGLRAWLVWGTAATVYLLAMFHRNGMSAAALHAQGRFDIGPALLSTLPMVQLVIYVLLQIPSGLLADRLGPRRSLLISLGVMAAGTVLFAVAPDAPTAIAGRILIGAGDSLVFLNTIRLAALWFPRRHYSLVSALTGLAGGLGQLVSAAPLSALLTAFGWEVSFLSAGAVNLVVGALVLLVIRDRPDGRRAQTHALLSMRESLAEALSHRGPRVGMAAHAVIMVPFTVLGVLWGYPLLEEGYGLSSHTTGVLLTGAMLLPMSLVPFLGRIPGHYPRARKPMGLGLAWTVTLVWLGVVLWPGGLPPLPVIAGVILVSAFASVLAPSISFDYARDGLPEQRTGAASGLVNMSGFTSVMLGVVGAGIVLDLGLSFQAAFVPMTLLCLVASTAMTLLLRNRRSRAAKK